MSDLFMISNDEQTKEIRPIGHINIEPPFDANLFLSSDFVTDKIVAFTDNSILDGKEKIITRQSPNYDALLYDVDAHVMDMLKQAAFSAIYEAIQFKVNVSLLLLFVFRRQFWDFEIVCQVYVDKAVKE